VRLVEGHDAWTVLDVADPLVSIPVLVIELATLTSAAPCIESIFSTKFEGVVVFTDVSLHLYLHVSFRGLSYVR